MDESAEYGPSKDPWQVGLGPEIEAETQSPTESGTDQWDLSAWFGYQGIGLESTPAPESASAVIHQKKSNKPLMVGTLAVLLIAGAITAGVASTRNGPPVPGVGTAPAAFVVSSTQDTLSQHSADLAITGTITAKGHQIPLQGTGTANFDTNAFSATINAPEGSGSLVERELVVDNHFYMGMTINGQDLSQLTGGAHWVSLPVPDQNSSSLGSANVDPLQQLQTLESKGAKVVPLGSSEIDGDVVSGFAVTPSRAEELQTVESELQSGAIPKAAVGEARRVAQGLAGFTMNVYFGGNHLLRRMTMDFPGGGSFTGSITMTFSNYGTSVFITPPSSGDIVSFDQFFKDVQAAGGTTG